MRNVDVEIHAKGEHIETPDGRVYYELEGTGPAVFLVAGGPGGSHASFHPWFSRLSVDHTVVYFDNVGRGRSDRLKERAAYTVPRDAEDIEALRQALGFETISIIGHSYGGYPALAYTLKYPERVSRLVLSDTLHSETAWQQNIDSANWNASHLYPEIWEQLLAMRQGGMLTSADSYQDTYGSAIGNIYWYDPSNQQKMFRSGDPVDGFNVDVYTSVIGDDPEWLVGGSMKGYDPSRAMQRMTTPTLICVGRFDRVALPAVALEMNRLIPDSRLVVFEESGHRPWVEEPERYFEVVGEFLR